MAPRTLAMMKQFLTLALRVILGAGWPRNCGAAYGKFRRISNFFRKGIKGGLDEFHNLVSLQSRWLSRHISLPSR
jgi:hypothetical protein